MMLWLQGLTGWAKWLAIGAVVATISAPIVAGVLYVRSAEAAKSDLRATRQDLADEKNKRIAWQGKARENATAYEQCELANEANAAAAEMQRLRAMNAEMRLALWEANADRDVEDFADEAIEFRDRGLDCPALDDDFRQWVRNDP